MALGITDTDFLDVANSYLIQKHEDQLRKQGTRFKIYFDTYDVVKMVQGIRVFNNKLSFDMSSFKSTSTLVHAFGYKGYLSSPIHMLPPHQGEFTNLLLAKDTHVFPKVKEVLDPIIKSFFYQTQLDKIREELGEVNIENLTDHLDTLKLEASTAFKGEYILKDVHWTERIKEMYTNKRLILEGNTNKVKDITNSPFYTKIKAALDKHRTTGYMKSNFLDAVALTQLQNELESFEEDPKNHPLPIFYATSRGIISAVKTLHEENKKWLTYKSHLDSDERIPIVRESTYFILDTIFTIKDQKNNVDRFFRKIRTNLDEKYQDFKGKMETAQIFGYENHIRVKLKKEFDQGINELISLQFINEIWLHKEGYTTLNGLISNFETYKTRVLELIPKEIDEEVATVLKELESNREKWNLIAEIFQSFDPLFDEIKSDFLPLKGRIDVFRDYGLMRFSFDKLKCLDVQMHIEAVFKAAGKNDEAEFNTELSNIASHIVTGVFENEEKDLLIGIGVLWILGRYDLIQKIWNRISKFPKVRYQVSLLNVASQAIKGYLSKEDVNKYLMETEEKHGQKYQIWLAYAFIYFRLWESTNKSRPIPNLIPFDEKKKLSSKINIELYELTKKLILKTLNFLENEEHKKGTLDLLKRQKHLLAVNNYLYYATRAAPDLEFLSDQVKMYYKFLFRHQRDNNVWQDRFFDTIGWYNLRLALINNKNKQAYALLLEQAYDFNEHSLKGVRTPREEKVYNELKTLIRELKIKAQLYE